MANAARDKQVGGTHYKSQAIQPWDVIDTWPLAERIGFYRGNLLKYTMRMHDKDAAADNVGKAEHYAAKLREVLGVCPVSETPCHTTPCPVAIDCSDRATVDKRRLCPVTQVECVSFERCDAVGSCSYTRAKSEGVPHPPICPVTRTPCDFSPGCNGEGEILSSADCARV